MSWVAVGVALAGVAINQVNTQRTERRQDQQLATSIRNQGDKQKQADAKVDEEVKRLEGSRSDDERASRLEDFMQTLRTNKGQLEGGLTPAIGSEAFRGDAAAAAGRVQQGAANSAGLLSRIDAPGMQRQGEAFSYGRLGTDLGLIGREARGQSWLDELRLRAIRRNPWMDAASAAAGGYSSAAASGGGSMPTGATGQVAVGYGSF